MLQNMNVGYVIYFEKVISHFFAIFVIVQFKIKLVPYSVISFEVQR